jgi:hypothetical protein
MTPEDLGPARREGSVDPADGVGWPPADPAAGPPAGPWVVAGVLPTPAPADDEVIELPGVWVP